MSKKLYTILFFAFIFSGLHISAQSSIVGNESYLIYAMMQKHHVRAKALDDSLSSCIFEEIITSLDPFGMVFIQSDIDSLETFRYSIDDEIGNKTEEFFTSFSTIFRLRSKEMVEQLKNVSLDDIKINEKDSLFYGKKDFPIFSESKEKRDKRYYRYLKSKLLDRIFEKDSSINPIYKTKYSDAGDLISDEFESVIQHEQRRLQYYENHSMGYINIMKMLYLNALTGYYDPHSMYFNPELNKWFQGKVNASNFSFGFTLEEDLNGNIKISTLLPGGPAWKSNSIHKGDILISGQWHGSEKQDFTLMSLDEIEFFLEQSVDNPFILEIKKPNGQTIEVDLKKEQVKEDEDIVHSYILEDKYKCGYIVLPSFYTDYDETINGCSNDVAREIMKLKKEGIEGLILDLRFNGGGSIQEALDLAGIFIDAGPICMVADNTGKAVSLKDRNRGTVWDGPLIIMVNAYSASASEILSAGLQDYNRALIVGQKTYGKASGQVVMPLDTSIMQDLSNLEFNKKADAYIKLTNFLVYRINGKSHQKTGVQPDIILPSFEKYNTEKDEPYALKNEPISKKSYYTPLNSLPIDTLNILYDEKKKTEPWYDYVEDLKDTLEILTKIDYRLFDYSSWQEFEYNLIKTQEYYFEKFQEYNRFFTASNHAFDKELLETDEFFRITNKANIEHIEDDHEILDALFLMDHLIKLTK